MPVNFGYPIDLAMMDKIETALVKLIESQTMAVGDFCGEQRAWHLPRITDAMLLIGQVFPKQYMAAFGKAKDAYGDSLDPNGVVACMARKPGGGPPDAA